MEIIDISKFYRFESIPNPLVIASDILEFNQSNENINEYIEIDNCKQWFSKFNTKKYFQKFDEILTTYFRINKDLSTNSQKNYNIKKVLNNSHIYLVIKIIKTDKNNSSFTFLPISNLENLSNTAVNRLYLHRDGLFEIDPNFPNGTLIQDKSSTNRRFYCLNELLTTQGVFDSELDTKIKDLTFETEDDLRKRKGLTNKILGDDPKFYLLSNYENLDYLPELDPEPNYRGVDDKDSIWLQKYGIPRQDYEYNEAEMDNTLFNNPTKYCVETSKEIFPLFENLNDAENFLLTAFEDLLEPLKKKKITITKKKFFELSRKEQYTLLLPTSYVLNIENSEVSDSLNLKPLISFNKLSVKNWLKKYYREKPDMQQIENIDTYKINNFDQNAFIPISNYFLLDQAMNIGILKVGLGDFLELWFSSNFTKEKVFSKPPVGFLKYLKMSKSNNLRGNLLFIPKLVNKNTDRLEVDSFDKFKQTKDFRKVFTVPRVNSTKFKFVYQLGKVMDVHDVNSLIEADLKL